MNTVAVTGDLEQVISFVVTPCPACSRSAFRPCTSGGVVEAQLGGLGGKRAAQESVRPGQR